MEAHFSEQAERVAHSEREAQAQQAVTAQMRAEWEAMKAEVGASSPNAAVHEGTGGSRSCIESVLGLRPRQLQLLLGLGVCADSAGVRPAAR